jgi:glycosyltransferase involved in cell wall biosynthesis
MRITYFHYGLANDTGMHHVRQFAAAIQMLGHAIDTIPLNLDYAKRPIEMVGNNRRASLARKLKSTLSPYLHEPKELLYNLAYLRKELDILSANRPDVLLVRDHLLTISSVLAAARLALPLVLELNAPAIESNLYLDEYHHLPWIPRAIEGFKVRRADAIVVVSGVLKSHLVDRHGIQAGKIFVAPNGADLDQFHPRRASDPALATELHDKVVVGFVGSFRKWHGTPLLAALMRALSASHPSVAFVLVGDGPEAPALRAVAEEFPGRIHMIGSVAHSRVPALVASFQIGVLPEALYYGSPLKLIEWMAAGRAIVAPRYPAIQELIEDGVDGLLFPPGDLSGLVHSVETLVNDQSLRDRLSRAAAEKAHRSLSWRDNACVVISACEQARRLRSGDQRSRRAAQP